jgi:protein archease
MARDILVRGATLQQAFSEAALGVFALAAEPAAVRALEVREVRAHGPSLEALLAQWIGECCYVHEIEGFVCHAIDFAVFDVEPKGGGEPMRLHAFLRGEEMNLDPDRTVKAMPLPDRPIRPLVDGYEIHLTAEG